MYVYNSGLMTAMAVVMITIILEMMVIIFFTFSMSNSVLKRRTTVSSTVFLFGLKVKVELIFGAYT